MPLAAPGAERHTIAVLPFVNMSGDAENEYFSDGISEEILNLLAKLPQLKVASRTSSFVFKGKETGIPAVARELGVGTVLEGSVRRAGEHVRITAQLIDAATDSHLWSETYDREMKDVFAIQDDIARSIVDALQVTLSPKERRALQNDATSNATAYDFYLKGRKYFYAMSRRNFLHALSMYEEAITIDPKYALACAGMARARSFLFRYNRDSSLGYNAVADEARRGAMQNDATSNATAYDFYLKGRKYFYAMSRRNFLHAMSMYEEAIKIDPKYALAYAGMADARSFLFRYYRDSSIGYDALADEASRRAVELDPDSAVAHTARGTALMFNGRHVDAEKHFETAIVLNPNLYEPYYFYGRACMSAGNTEKAARQFMQAADINPGGYEAPGFLGQAYLAMGRTEAARQALETAMANIERHLQMNPDDSWALGTGAVNLASLGERNRAIEWTERAIEASGEEPIIFYNSACTFAVLGEHDRALDLLERSRSEEHTSELQSLMRISYAV